MSNSTVAVLLFMRHGVFQVSSAASSGKDVKVERCKRPVHRHGRLPVPLEHSHFPGIITNTSHPARSVHVVARRPPG